ncbi:hypothetical protein P7K49_000904 [Saguinus oedipus]|uniref:nucleoside-diphosphate kinase n=1 Tax=Saguinus oedipus TaxID=9490 RepID=A0ABQ9WCY5_SAGOE|nr:hypothetical protein P7K49_000904 [Saguinus oedipus]
MVGSLGAGHCSSQLLQCSHCLPPSFPDHVQPRVHLHRHKATQHAVGLLRNIMRHFELKEFHLWASEEHLKQHYPDLKDYPFLPGLVKYMNSGPVMAMAEGLSDAWGD